MMWMVQGVTFCVVDEGEWASDFSKSISNSGGIFGVCGHKYKFADLGMVVYPPHSLWFRKGC